MDLLWGLQQEHLAQGEPMHLFVEHFAYQRGLIAICVGQLDVFLFYQPFFVPLIPANDLLVGLLFEIG